MIVVGRIVFAVLATAGILTVIALGRPGRYPDRGVAWYLSATAWSALLIDAMFALLVLGVVHGRWVGYVLMGLFALRIPLAVWLLWMIVRTRRRT